MKTPYANQIVNAMRAEGSPPWTIVGRLEAMLTNIQRDAEDGTLTPDSVLAFFERIAAPEEPTHP